MQKTLRLIHASDLHLERANNKDSAIVLRGLIEDFGRLVSEQRAPHLFLFSGDLVNKGDDPDSYSCAKADFLAPAIRALGIDFSRVCIVPGNHDVQVSRINEVYDKGLTETFVSRGAIDKFFDDYIVKHSNIIEPLFSNFNAMKAEIGQQSSNSLLDVKSYDFPCGRVGVAMLNSAWRASGKGRNYDLGRLVVGERQIDAAASALADCHFRVAMFHHPLDWLMPIDKASVLRSLQRSFDLILTGHAHMHDPATLVGLTGRFIQSQTGCLYQTRDYYNGYSVIEIDFERKNVCIEMREYYDERRGFDISLRSAKNGRVTHPLQRESGALDLILSAEAEAAFQESVNQRLITCVASADAPRNIKEIFVEPTIATAMEMGVDESKDGSVQEVALDVVMRSPKDVVILGQREAGKTTLLNFLAVESLPGGRYFDGKLPLRLQFQDVGRSVATVLEGIRRASGGTIEIRQIRSALKSQRSLIIVDDFDIEREDRIEIFKKFLVEFPGNRLVYAARFEPVKGAIDFAAELGLSVDTLYLRYFGRKQVRELISRWLGKRGADEAELADQLMLTANRINAPVTPLLMSVLMWLRERQISFEPVNQAVLIQTFVRELMGKLGGAEVRRAELDLRNIEHFLGNFAEFLTTASRVYAPRVEVERVAAEYFSKRFDIRLLRFSVGELVGDLISRGILLESEDGIGFRYRCFFEYFAAIQMGDEKAFYEFVTSRENLLRFSSEIDTFSALNRNDLVLLSKVMGCSFEHFEGLRKRYELTGFERLPLPAGLKAKIDRDEIKRDLVNSTLDDEVRDKIFDASSGCVTNQAPLSIIKDREFYFPGESLDLASRVLRNSELLNIPSAERQAQVGQLCEYWGLLLADLIVGVEQRVEQQGVPKEVQRIGPVLSLVIFPQVLVDVATESLGSAKIGHMLRTVAEDRDAPLIARTFASLIFFDLRLEGRLVLLRKLLPLVIEKRFLLGILFFHLRMAYSFVRYKKSEASELMELLVEVWVAFQGGAHLGGREYQAARTSAESSVRKILQMPT
jgi:predicted MPP superfamily phosphohydrolase